MSYPNFYSLISQSFLFIILCVCFWFCAISKQICCRKYTICWFQTLLYTIYSTYKFFCYHIFLLTSDITMDLFLLFLILWFLQTLCCTCSRVFVILRLSIFIFFQKIKTWWASKWWHRQLSWYRGFV